MIPTLDSSRTKSRLLSFVGYFLSALLLLLIHLVLLDFINIEGLTPDLLVILCVWIALSEGGFTGLIAGFIVGLLYDIASNELVGVNALTKTIAAFVAGRFYREGSPRLAIGNIRFLLVVLLSALAANVAYYIFYIKFSQFDNYLFFLKYGIASSFYTTVVAIFPMLIVMRKKGR